MIDVSRETRERLETYESLLKKWNPAINLVSKSTLDDAWTRHFVDSAQIFDLTPDDTRHWVDIGSGGGFPGLVVAIMAAEARPEMSTTLIESDLRKATFLRTVIRETGISAKVLSERIEKAPPQQADVLSARALAPLTDLLGFAERHLSPKGLTVFPKGKSAVDEINAALETWSFDLQKVVSQTDSDAVILLIRDIRRAK
ncbi:16S rRNA (guanine(527)-N(7))-methyltransferase RsmG [Actibacterium pelagium]|uniref:Ribosomal RNA small subunit methyltransferase G n=1 Tax=Actibacterium pelagium TaxID=2029103 RepID=A0A917AID9_9RHOB|nr:16S rRNA (guanine(527)-N(7))-methyltransferase RsmG [Actibacterium pelagium]GGE55404.1 ribosomal RNA small subunit methyltransferase G [Actibacterium pelagium]